MASNIGKDASMTLTPEQLTAAVMDLRTAISRKKDQLRRELDYTEKRDAVLAIKDRYPDISDDQIHEVMRRADE
jgi:hypothetical protein